MKNPLRTASLLVLLLSGPSSVAAAPQRAVELPPARDGLEPAPSGGRTTAALVPATTWNLGLADALPNVLRPSFELEGDFVACLIGEAAQGADLDGDGVLDDFVLHVLDLAARTTTNVGLSCDSPPVLDGRTVLVRVLERAVGADLNGDGDQTDALLHSYDLVRGDVLDLGLQGQLGYGTFHPPIAARGGHGVFLFAESIGFGFPDVGEDYNGDGDDDDVVLQLFDHGAANRLRPASSALRLAWHARLALSAAVREGDTLFLGVDERAEGGRDRNGDGDADDAAVLASVDLQRGGPVVEHGLAFSALQAGPRFVALLVPEAAQGGLDQNGDGDALDQVAFLLDRVTGSLTDLGLAASSAFVLGDRIALLVPEAAQGNLDRNGDGDTLDTVLSVVDGRTGVVIDVGISAVELAGAGGRLLLRVAEAAEGGLDRNGDGDALDTVLASYELATGLLTNLSTAVLGMRSGERLCWLWVSEPSQSADFDFDGDASDNVAALYDGATDTFVNLALAMQAPAVPGTPAAGSFVVVIDGDRLAFLLDEAAQGGLDVNGDGDANDHVLVVHRRSDLTTVCTGLASRPGKFVLDGERALVSVPEFQQGPADANGDGDTSDFVLWVAELP